MKRTFEAYALFLVWALCFVSLFSKYMVPLGQRTGGVVLSVLLGRGKRKTFTEIPVVCLRGVWRDAPVRNDSCR